MPFVNPTHVHAALMQQQRNYIVSLCVGPQYNVLSMLSVYHSN